MIKRPKDSNQLAKLLVDIATGQVKDEGAPANVGIDKVKTRKVKKNPDLPKPANQKGPLKSKKQKD